LGHIRDGVVELDREQNVTYVSRVAERMLGRSAADLRGRKAAEAFPELRNVLRQKIEAAQHSDDPVTFEVELPTGTGRGRILVSPTNQIIMLIESGDSVGRS
jgi:PAS domain S-box-containing protein